MGTTHTVFFFPNGNTVVCQGNDQVPELQFPWLLMFVAHLERHGIDPLHCEFRLPNARLAKLFKLPDGSYNWRIE